MTILPRRWADAMVAESQAWQMRGSGWADDASGKIQITAAGKQVRAEVETETERLFFAPWSSLNESELEELSHLARQLHAGMATLTRNTE